MIRVKNNKTVWRMKSEKLENRNSTKNGKSLCSRPKSKSSKSSNNCKKPLCSDRARAKRARKERRRSDFIN